MQGGVGGVWGGGGHWGPNCNEPALGGPSLQKVENPCCKLLHVISMIRVIRCTKFHFSRLRGSRVITILMLNF